MKVLQLHKRSSYEFKAIQDKWDFNPSMGCLALADGTTQSFKSEIWADIVTSGFVTNPTFNENLLVDLLKVYAESFKNREHQFSSNPAKASLERSKQNKGGTSTFLGLQFNEKGTIDIISCGDSNLFLLKSNGESICFPYSDVDSLDNNNKFLNTEQLLLNEVEESFFNKKSLPFSQDDTLILATDALSRLMLSKPDVIPELLYIENFEGFHEFCLKYWKSNELEEDDISAVIISKSNLLEVQKIQPSEDFSFPKEEEYEFVPNPGLPESINEIPMSEIINQFNGVAQDFHIVKKKQKRHSILLISLFVLMLVNLGVMLFISFKMNHREVEISKSNSEKTFTEWVTSMFHLNSKENEPSPDEQQPVQE
jgi:serine/threonine protein phosphatase PrpC